MILFSTQQKWLNKSCFGSDTQHTTITDLSGDSTRFSPNPSILINSPLDWKQSICWNETIFKFISAQIKIKNFITSRPPISSRWRPWPKSPRQTWSARHCGQWTRIRSASIWRYSGPLPSRTRTRQSWRSWRMRSANLSRRIRRCLSSYLIRRKSRRSSSKV